MNELTVIPLGTVSPYCKDNTNCPGFLIKYNNQNILLDCGNGITRLLKFPMDLNNLNIFITHYHKDHIGDISIIQYASYVYNKLGLLENKIKIYLPEQDFNYNLKSILSNKETYSSYLYINDCTKINIEDLEVTFKDNKSHTIESYMVKLQNKDFKVVYTSDIGTTNFEDLIEFCKESDLLICESSFLRSHNSKSKTHLTAYDAGRLANLSESKNYY